ncbi:inner membrane protein YcdZ [Escherichia coli]|uniref:Inner membrane protein YcdZ n=1 Tax=Escherichia coli TaxID=562 RepID=A0A376KW92_ECOLX|nr:inner membrane protein YcdZ [Escherichia coli]
MAAFSAIMRGMNILLSIAITTGILSGIWGWVAVSLGLLSWAGFLGCTAYFACPQGGLKGLAISAATLLSGVVWAMGHLFTVVHWHHIWKFSVMS